MDDVITIPKTEYLEMKNEIVTLRKTNLYKRLLEFEENISKGRTYTRKDLGF